VNCTPTNSVNNTTNGSFIHRRKYYLKGNSGLPVDDRRVDGFQDPHNEIKACVEISVFSFLMDILRDLSAFTEYFGGWSYGIHFPIFLNIPQ
jgi:hypothetical protein